MRASAKNNKRIYKTTTSDLRHNSSNRESSLLAESLAHELRTPLTSINLLTQNLHYEVTRLSMKVKKNICEYANTESSCLNLFTLSDRFLHDIHDEISSSIFMMDLFL